MLKKIFIGSLCVAFLLAVTVRFSYAQEQEGDNNKSTGQFPGRPGQFSNNNSGSDDNSGPNIQNPFRPSRRPSKENSQDDSSGIPSDSSLLQQFQNQEMGRVRSEMHDKMQQFKHIQNTCGQQISAYVRQRNQERQQLTKECQTKVKSLQENNGNSFGDSSLTSLFTQQDRVKQMIQNRQNMMKSCKAEMTAFQKETQQHVRELQRACVTNKRQVLGMMTTTASP